MVVIVFLGEDAWVSSFAGVVFGAATPLDVGFVHLLVGVHALGHGGLGELLAVLLGHRGDQLVDCLAIAGFIRLFT